MSQSDEQKQAADNLRKRSQEFVEPVKDNSENKADNMSPLRFVQQRARQMKSEQAKDQNKDK